MSLRALYYANAIVPFVIDSIIYAAIFTFLASIVFKPADTLSAEEKSKHKRLSLVLAFAMGPIFAGTLYSANLNLEKLVSGGLLWAFLLLFGVIIIITLIIPLFKTTVIDPATGQKVPKTKNGIPKWIWIVIPLIIFLIALTFRSFDPVSGALGKTGKGIFDLFIYFGLFVFLIVILIFTTKWKTEGKKKDVTDADLSGVTDSLKEIHDRLKKIEEGELPKTAEKKEKKKKKTKLEKILEKVKNLIGKVFVFAEDAEKSLDKASKKRRSAYSISRRIDQDINIEKGLRDRYTQKMFPKVKSQVDQHLNNILVITQKIQKRLKDSKKFLELAKREGIESVFEFLDWIFANVKQIEELNEAVQRVRPKVISHKFKEDWEIKVHTIKDILDKMKRKCVESISEIEKWIKWLKKGKLEDELPETKELEEPTEEDEIEPPVRQTQPSQEEVQAARNSLNKIEKEFVKINSFLPPILREERLNAIRTGLETSFYRVDIDCKDVIHIFEKYPLFTELKTQMEKFNGKVMKLQEQNAKLRTGMTETEKTEIYYNMKNFIESLMNELIELKNKLKL